MALYDSITTEQAGGTLKTHSSPTQLMANNDSDHPNVLLKTSMGDITLELYWDHAPKTCTNFKELVKKNYYNRTVFHRVIPDFMVQGGDPTGTGRGGTSIYGHKFDDEINGEELRFVGAGILAMANAGPNTNGSQFFMTLAPTPYLDGKHTIFGRVSNGMGVLRRLGSVATDGQDRPKEDIMVHEAQVIESLNSFSQG